MIAPTENAEEDKVPTLQSKGPRVNHMDKLVGILDERMVLIPVTRGTKVPMRKAWQQTTLQQTTDPDYIADLRNNSAAVLLGPPSGHLVDIDCDDDKFMMDFNDANRDLLRNTLRYKGVRGQHVMFRMKGDYPAKVHVIKNDAGDHVGEFRGGNCCSMVSGKHPSGCRYQFLNPAPPSEIEFSQINWPAGYTYPWVIPEDQAIAMQVGPAFEENKGKASRINAAFFAEWIKLCEHVIFEETESCFYHYAEKTGLWMKVSDGVMAEICWKVCQEWIDQQDTQIIDSLKLLFTQRARMDIIAMLKCKAATKDFFSTGPHFKNREKFFHCLDGMLRVFPEAGPTAVTYFKKPYSEAFRSRFKFPCRYVENPICPQFDRLLVSAFGVENVPFVLKVLGYLLIDGNPAQHIVVIKGPARSGKSQLALILQGLFGGGSWAQLRTSQLDGRFELAGFTGKRVIYGPDVRKDFFCVEGARNLKALTGGDLMEAELKFTNERATMVGDKHVLVTTNDVLRLAPGEDAGAWRRRLIILKSNGADPSQIVVNLAEAILATERDAVFSKLLNAAYGAFVEMKETGLLDIPDEFRLGVSDAVVLMGDVQQWVSSCVSEGGASFSTQELYVLHSRWCQARGEMPSSQSSFEKALKRLLEELGHESSHSILRNGHHCNGYRGLEVKP